jgi:hypothetical protein
MSTITPNAVTEIVPATYGAANILIALHAHINSVSTSFSIDLVAAGGAGDGFAFTADADPTPQYIFRRLSASTWAMSIEPSGSVTVVGTTAAAPTGTSADWSGERTFTVGTLGAGSKIWLSEHDDALTCLMKTAAGTSWQAGFHIGRIIQPDFPSVDVPLGFDGLGFLYGAPVLHSSTPTNHFITSAASTLPNTSYGLMHSGINTWRPPMSINTPSVSADADDITYAAYIRPGKIPVAPIIRSGYTNNVATGSLKYFMRGGSGRTPLTRVDVNNLTDLAFIAGGLIGSTNTSNNTGLFPWLRGVVA